MKNYEERDRPPSAKGRNKRSNDNSRRNRRMDVEDSEYVFPKNQGGILGAVGMRESLEKDLNSMGSLKHGGLPKRRIQKFGPKKSRTPVRTTEPLARALEQQQPRGRHQSSNHSTFPNGREQNTDSVSEGLRTAAVDRLVSAGGKIRPRDEKKLKGAMKQPSAKSKQHKDVVDLCASGDEDTGGDSKIPASKRQLQHASKRSADSNSLLPTHRPQSVAKAKSKQMQPPNGGYMNQFKKVSSQSQPAETRIPRKPRKAEPETSEKANKSPRARTDYMSHFQAKTDQAETLLNKSKTICRSLDDEDECDSGPEYKDLTNEKEKAQPQCNSSKQSTRSRRIRLEEDDPIEGKAQPQCNSSKQSTRSSRRIFPEDHHPIDEKAQPQCNSSKQSTRSSARICLEDDDSIEDPDDETSVAKKNSPSSSSTKDNHPGAHLAKKVPRLKIDTKTQKPTFSSQRSFLPENSGAQSAPAACGRNHFFTINSPRQLGTPNLARPGLGLEKVVDSGGKKTIRKILSSVCFSGGQFGLSY
jgi:hypothetical protein